MTSPRKTQSEAAGGSDNEAEPTTASQNHQGTECADKLQTRVSVTRELSLKLAEPLSPEDQTVQAMPDASPTKWHLAHTTWFFEEFILATYLEGYKRLNTDYNFCFNSYYEAKGARHPRPDRGLLTRPGAQEVKDYRLHVDEGLERLFATGQHGENHGLAQLLELGINHEQQHQELLLTDILSLFAKNPLFPAYRRSKVSDEDRQSNKTGDQAPVNWLSYDGGIFEVGYSGDGFHFDNERPVHEVLLRPFKLLDRAVTNSDWLEFIKDGGYENAALWLSDGWATINELGWNAPEYWQKSDGLWWQMSLNGLLPVEPAEPVTHISYYEADAYARWAGKRLPTEYEWEVAAGAKPVAGNFLDPEILKPRPALLQLTGKPRQMLGDVWEWTSSPYTAYPGYRAVEGAVGEYNGKFMSNQYILRGGSCATPEGHIRTSYRNFFYPHQRWQFTGLRLADDIS